MQQENIEAEKIKTQKIKTLSRKLIQNDFVSFIEKCFATVSPGDQYLPNWHIEIIAAHLIALEKGEIKKLIINIPPRNLKSICASVSWPAWLLGHAPEKKIIVGSYSSHLSIKHSLDTRLIMESKWYREIFPQTILTKDQNEKNKFTTTKRGFRIATSVNGSITGEGGDFLITDDPHNPTFINSELIRKSAINWFDKTFTTRLNDKKNGAFVVIMQRLHEDDLSGHLLKRKGWKLLKIPAIFEKNITYNIGNLKFKKNKGEFLHAEREGKKEISSVQRDLGSSDFAAQYLQEPVPKKGNLINFNWFKKYNALPKFETIIQSWDTAIKVAKHNDFSACTTWGIDQGKFYLLDVFRIKMNFPDLKRNIIQLYSKYQASLVIIEDKASGQSLIQQLKHEGNINILPFNPVHDKVTRFAANSVMVEAGHVYIPEEAEWLFDFERELSLFPESSNDDIVDSFSQFLSFTNSKNLTIPKIRKL